MILGLQCLAFGADTQARRFDISAGDARESLRQFAVQAGVEIMFSAEQVRGTNTPALNGSMTATEAINRLLSGSGLEARIDPKTGAIAILRSEPKSLGQPQTPPTGKANLPAPRNEDILSLDEFNVTAKPTTGYRATNSITATGIDSRILDTPIPISVVSTELLADTANTELREALNFVPGVLTNPRAESTFIVRGYSGLTAYRNGQYRRQLFPTWNVDRVEVVKGPSAIFFGVTRPGGVINYVTQKPVIGSNFADTKVTVGSDAYYKGEVFTNQSLGDKVGLRLGLGYLDAGGPRQLEYKREFYAGGSLAWRPSERHQLTLDLEHIDRELYYLNSYGGRALSNSKYLGNTTVAKADETKVSADTDLKNWISSQGYSSTPGASNFLPRYDIFAPIYGENDPQGATVALTADAKNTFKSETADLDYLFRATPSLVWQSSLNYSKDDTAGIQPTDGETRPYADGSVRFKFEDWNNIRDSYNFDNKLTWRFELGKTNHTLQVGQEFQRIVYDRPGYLDSANKYNESVYGAYVYNVKFGVTPLVSTKAGMAAGTQSPNVLRRRTDDTTGWFAAMQSRFFDERLLFLYGGRYTQFDGKTWYDRPVLIGSALSQKEPYGAEGGFTPQIGTLFKVLPDLSAFASYSRSIEPDSVVDADGNSSEPVKSKGLDVGLKGELLDGRANFTATYYTITRENLKYNDTDKQNATGRSPFFIYGNAERSSGLELEANLSPFSGYQVMAGWNHFLEAKTLRSNDATRIGARMPYTPTNSCFLWNRYELQNGPAKGLTFGIGLRHNDAARISNDPQVIVKNPSFTVYDLMIAYTVKPSKQPFKLQLNVKNAGNKRYREGTDGYFGPLRQILFSIQTRF